MRQERVDLGPWGGQYRRPASAVPAVARIVGERLAASVALAGVGAAVLEYAPAVLR